MGHKAWLSCSGPSWTTAWKKQKPNRSVLNTFQDTQKHCCIHVRVCGGLILRLESRVLRLQRENAGTHYSRRYVTVDCPQLLLLIEQWRRISASITVSERARGKKRGSRNRVCSLHRTATPEVLLVTVISAWASPVPSHNMTYWRAYTHNCPQMQWMYLITSEHFFLLLPVNTAGSTRHKLLNSTLPSALLIVFTSPTQRPSTTTETTPPLSYSYRYSCGSFHIQERGCCCCCCCF